MPQLLAAATAEAHLDLSGLDSDLAEATASITAAFERIEEQARISVTVQTSEALSELEALEASIGDIAADITVRVDEQQVAEAGAEIRSLIGDITAEVTVDVDAAAARTELETLDVLVRDRTLTVDVDISEAETELASLRTSLEGLSANANVKLDETQAAQVATELRTIIGDVTANVAVKLDPAAAAVELAALDELTHTRDVDLNVTVDGIVGAQTELAALDTQVAAANSTVRIDVDTADVGATLTTLTAVETAVTRLRAETASAVTITFDLDGLEPVLAGLETVRAASVDDFRVRVDTETTGVETSLADLAALRAAAKDVTAQVTVEVDSDRFAIAQGTIRTLGSDVTATVQVETDVATAMGELAALQTAVTGVDGTVRVDVDIADVGTVITALGTLQTAVTELRAATATAITIDVDLDGMETALAQIAGLETGLAALANSDASTEIDASVTGLGQSLADIALMREAVDTLDGHKIDIDTDVHGTTGVIAEVNEIWVALRYIDGYSDVNITVKASGVTEVLAEVSALEAVITKLDRRVVSLNLGLKDLPETIAGLTLLETVADRVDGKTVTVDSDLSFMDRIRNVFGGGDPTGMNAATAAAKRNVAEMTESFQKFTHQAGITKVGLTDLAGGIRELPDTKNLLRFDPGELASVRTELAAMQASAGDIDIGIDVNGKSEMVEALTVIEMLHAAAGRDVTLGIDATVHGVAKVMAELAAVKAAAKAASSDVNIRFDTKGLSSSLTTAAFTGVADAADNMADAGSAASRVVSELGGSAAQMGTQAAGGAGGVSKLGESVSGLGAGASEAATKVGGSVQKVGGMLLKFNLIAGLIASLVGLVAWLVPLATGLIGAAAGFLAFAAAATVAAGAVAGLVFLLPGTMDMLSEVFAGFKQQVSSLAPIFEPIKKLLVSSLGVALNSVLVAAQKLAPVFNQIFEPLIDAILPIIDVLGEVAGPVAQAVGEGLTQVVLTLRGLFEAVDLSVVIESTNAFFYALDRLIDLLGQTGLVFPLVELLTSLGDIFEQAIDPFIQIIADFRQNFEGIGAGLTELFTPIGEFARTVGLAVAALAPQLSTIFQLITGFIPLMNFDVLGVAFETFIPQIVLTLETLRPSIEQLTQGWMDLMDSFSEGNRVLLVPMLIQGMLLFGQVLLKTAEAAGWLFSAFVTGVTKGAEASGYLIMIAATIGQVFSESFQYVENNLSRLLGLIAEFLVAMLKLPGASKIPGLEEAAKAFDSASGAVKGFGDGVDEGADSAREFGAFWANNAEKIMGFQIRTMEGARSLDSYSGAAGRATRSTKALTAEQKLAGRVTTALSQAYAPLTEVIGKSQEYLKGGFSDFIADDAAKTEKATKNYSGLLSGYFQSEADAADKAQQAGVDILEAGSLSEFMNRENLNIDRAIYTLIENLQQKTENIRKLNFIAALGFGELAEQLATLRDNPRMLAAAIDDLTRKGVGAMRDANGQIASAQDGYLAQIDQLNPGLEAVFGLAGKTAEDGVDGLSTSITDAMNSMAIEQAQHAKNIAKLGALYGQGFTALANQLFASFEGDPGTLQAAMEQVGAMSSAELSKLNSAMSAGVDAVAAERDKLPAAMRLDIGLEDSDLGADKVKEQFTKSLDDIAKEWLQKGEDFRYQMEGISALIKSGNGIVAQKLAGLEPDAFRHYYDELMAGGDQGVTDLKNKLELNTLALADTAKTTMPTITEAIGDPEQFKLALAEQFNMTPDEVEAWLTQTGKYIEEAAAELGTYAERGFSAVGEALKGGPGEKGEEGHWLDKVLPDASKVAEDSAKIGGTYADGIAEGINARSAEASQASADLIVTASGVALRYTRDAGYIVGVLFDNSVALGITERSGVIGPAVIEAMSGLAGIATPMAWQAGYLSGAAFNMALATGVGGTAGPVLSVAVIQMFSGVAPLATELARQAGVGAGATLSDGIAVGVLAGSPAVAAGMLKLFTGMSKLAADAGNVVGGVVILGLGAAIAEASSAVTRQVAILFNNVGRDVAQIAIETGTVLGNRFARGLVTSIVDAQGAVTVITAALFVRAIDAIDVLVVNFGKIVGLQFALGLTIGLDTASLGVRIAALRLAAVVMETLQEALGINSPSLVAAGIGGQVGAGLVEGLNESKAVVTGAAAELGTTVTDAITGAVASIPEFTPQITPQVNEADMALASTRVGAQLAAPNLAGMQVDMTGAVATAQSQQAPTATAAAPEMLAALSAIVAAIKSNPTVIESLFENYNVYGVDKPQTPQQLAADADFVAALVR